MACSQHVSRYAQTEKSTVDNKKAGFALFRQPFSINFFGCLLADVRRALTVFEQGEFLKSRGMDWCSTPQRGVLYLTIQRRY
jgi:hypothetical protein